VSSKARLPSHTLTSLQGYFGGDCSQHAEALAYDKPLHVEEAAFEYQYYGNQPTDPRDTPLPPFVRKALLGKVEEDIDSRFEASSSCVEA